tara:strand:+ start:14888 stop:15040 length:153 start_codon:yes stop_codon:yes gene_type:complete
VENEKETNQKINLELNYQEVNTVIEALGHLPFMRVYKLIEKVHLQSKKKS